MMTYLMWMKCAKKISSSVIWWQWIYVFVVLPYSWVLLWFSFNIWSRREKRPIFFTLQISTRGTLRHIHQYSKYCCNREPYYFSCTKFWHDLFWHDLLFYGIPHKSGKAFKSSRVSSLTNINSETCEQFNSYLQCIKYTGSHLSQPHFMFLYSFLFICGTEIKPQNSRKLYILL